MKRIERAAEFDFILEELPCRGEIFVDVNSIVKTHYDFLCACHSAPLLSITVRVQNLLFQHSSVGYSDRHRLAIQSTLAAHFFANIAANGRASKTTRIDPIFL